MKDLEPKSSNFNKEPSSAGLLPLVLLSNFALTWLHKFASHGSASCGSGQSVPSLGTDVLSGASLNFSFSHNVSMKI